MKSDYETALDMMTEIIGQMRRMPERRQPAPEEPPEGFAQLDEDVPF